MKKNNKLTLKQLQQELEALKANKNKNKGNASRQGPENKEYQPLSYQYLIRK